MKTNTDIRYLVTIFLVLISNNILASSYYKCSIMASYDLTDTGLLKREKTVSPAYDNFTIDRKTGIFRQSIIDTKLRVVTVGSKDELFRAVLSSPNRNEWDMLLTIREYSDTKLKPYILFRNMSTVIDTGKCEKF